MLGCVMVCGRDEACLQPFITAWQLVSDIPLHLIVDRADPIEGDYGLPVTMGVWPASGPISQPVLESLAEAAAGYAAVLKMDVDCLHMDAAWLEEWQPESMAAMGFQHCKRPECFMGAAYVLDVETAKRAALRGDCCQIRAEDVGASQRVRRLQPNGIHLFSRENDDRCCNAVGWVPDEPLENYAGYALVHCGQHLEHGRGDIPARMNALLNAHF